MQSYRKNLEHNVIQIDSGYMREGLAACYIVTDSNRVAIIDTGVEKTVFRIEAALADLGLSFANVDYIVPTHVHLDHAGAAGRLMQLCPHAGLVIHPYGSRHMIDPSMLIAGAQAVYGEQGLRESVGKIVAVDAERVIEAPDQYRFSVGNRELVIVDTPGHARHHFCVWDELSKGFFSGDTFGLAYPELECDGRSFIFPPTTPVQFDPVAWHASIGKLLQWQPERMYLTHFGVLHNPQDYALTLKRRIDNLASIALEAGADMDAISDAVEKYAHRELDSHGCRLSKKKIAQVFELDLNIIVQGLFIWLKRQ